MLKKVFVNPANVGSGCVAKWGKSLSSGDTPGVSHIYDLRGGASEQDDFTLLQERWNLWREVGEDFTYCPRWWTSLDVIILFRFTLSRGPHYHYLSLTRALNRRHRQHWWEAGKGSSGKYGGMSDCSGIYHVCKMRRMP